MSGGSRSSDYNRARDNTCPRSEGDLTISSTEDCCWPTTRWRSMLPSEFFILLHYIYHYGRNSRYHISSSGWHHRTSCQLLPLHHVLSSYWFRYAAEERGFGNSIFPKILVIVSQAFAWGQLLLLPLDLSITTADPSSNFLLVYEIVYPIIFALVVFLNPLAMHFY